MPLIHTPAAAPSNALSELATRCIASALSDLADMARADAWSLRIAIQHAIKARESILVSLASLEGLEVEQLRRSAYGDNAIVMQAEGAALSARLRDADILQPLPETVVALAEQCIRPFMPVRAFVIPPASALRHASRSGIDIARPTLADDRAFLRLGDRSFKKEQPDVAMYWYRRAADLYRWSGKLMRANAVYCQMLRMLETHRRWAAHAMELRILVVATTHRGSPS